MEGICDWIASQNEHLSQLDFKDRELDLSIDESRGGS